MRKFLNTRNIINELGNNLSNCFNHPLSFIAFFDDEKDAQRRR